jgi:3-phosphoshikimate 1-carboxyvinyltransferase
MSIFKNFKYAGPIESSKSIVNRALILKAIHPSLKLKYISHAQDILDLEESLEQFKNYIDQNLKDQGQNKISTELTLYVGSGGTTFRFLALFLSKYMGQWNLKISSQLAKRPHEDLIKILSQLGVNAQYYKDINAVDEIKTEITASIKNDNLTKIKNENKMGLLTLHSNFWQANSVEVDFSKSSQFFTALALAASDSKTKFTINCLNRDQSSGYESITLDLLKKIGVQVEDHGNSVEIQNLEIKSSEVSVGADWSSVIYILSFCFSGSKVEITNLDLKSLEPDLNGLEFLKQMGLKYKIESSDNFSVLKTLPSELNSNTKFLDLKNNPDLFPQLVILMSQMAEFHKTEVQIQFMKQLVYKESDRLNVMIDVLKELGFKVKVENQILTLQTTVDVDKYKKSKTFSFDSKSDHRLIMCFELLKSFGYKVSYNNKDEVKKSFSNFFEILHGQ